MKLQQATLVSAAVLLGIAVAPEVVAGPSGGHSRHASHGSGYSQHGHSAGGHSGTRFIAHYPVRAIPRTVFPRTVFPRPVFWAAPPAYAPASYYAPPPVYYPPPIAANASPSVYYVPPIAANAPPFSFNGSAAEPEWGWQRVNLQQLVQEVRAKREAAKKP